jgi:hypothetical protein
MIAPRLERQLGYGGFGRDPRLRPAIANAQGRNLHILPNRQIAEQPHRLKRPRYTLPRHAVRG